MKPNIIFGPPGTGKTTHLLNILETELQQGTPPDKIAFLSFTKKAVSEATERAATRFKIDKGHFKYFRTIHSLAFQQLGLTSDKVISGKQYQEFSKIVGLPISENITLEDGLPIGKKSKGDLFLQLSQLARCKLESLHDVWSHANPDCQFIELDRFSEAYDRYKTESGIFDFTNMLELAIYETKPIKLDVVIIDEAQDLFPLQWEYINPFCEIAQRVYIAGDPDQALYEWSGATPDYLLNMEGNRETLEQSYRVPKRVHELAMKIIGRCSNTYDKKKYKPCKSKGKVIDVNGFENIPFDNDESWYLLARNSYLLPQLEAHIKEFRVPYTIRNKPGINQRDAHTIEAWEKLRQGCVVSDETCKKIYDYFNINKEVKRGFKSLSSMPEGHYSIQDLKDNYGLLTDAPWYVSFNIPQPRKLYYISVTKNMHNLTDTPLIHINTIHGVKGGEADNIFLLTDMAWKSYNSMNDNSDAEHRVFYVAVTRAKNNLYIMQPQGKYYYEL